LTFLFESSILSIMEQLPTLYKRTKTGAVQQWTIFIDGSQFWTESGQVGGQLTTSEPTQAKPKNTGRANATTAEEQASAEAKAKWDKNLKTGYKLDKGDIDTKTYVEPMLAKQYKDYRDKIDWSKGVFGQTKANGCRAIITKDGAFSRKGERWLTVDHITDSLKPFFAEYPDAVLDGELFNEDLRQELNQLMSIVRKTKNIKPEDIQKSREIVRFYCYDGYNFGGISQKSPYKDRWSAIIALVQPFRFVEHVDTIPFSTEEGLMEFYQSLIAEGHEGTIIRFIDSPYENKRSKYLLKLKPESSSEAIIRDVSEGSGNWSGTGKIITLEWKGILFDATFKGTKEDAANFWENRSSWVGRTVTFLYNDLTGLGVPNFARVDYRNCIKS
jgi:DNA ligase-1